MYKTTIRLPADYWQVIDMYGNYNDAINNAISFVLQESLIDLPVSRESNEGEQISRNVTIVNTEYERLHNMYGASRHISLRRIITYLVDNCLYDAFAWNDNSIHDTLTPIEQVQYKQLYKLLYKAMANLSLLDKYCEKLDKPTDLFNSLYRTLNDIRGYYDEKYNTQSANRDNATRAVRERLGTDVGQSGTGDSNN